MAVVLNQPSWLSVYTTELQYICKLYPQCLALSPRQGHSNESFLMFSMLLINHSTAELRLHLADGEDEETKAQGVKEHASGSNSEQVAEQCCSYCLKRYHGD